MELLGISFGLGAPWKTSWDTGLMNWESQGASGLFAAKHHSGTCSRPFMTNWEQFVQWKASEPPSRWEGEMSKNWALLIFPPWNSSSTGRSWNYALNFSLPWARAIVYILFHNGTVWNWNHHASNQQEHGAHVIHPFGNGTSYYRQSPE